MPTAAIALACLIASPQAIAQEKATLRLATLGSGSAWFHYGAGIAGIVTPKLPAGSSIEMVETPVGTAGIEMLQAGKAELAFSLSVTSAEACAGTGAFKEKQTKLRALVGGLARYYFATFVTRKSGVTSWEEIAAGKNKFWLKTGGTGEQAVRQIFGLLGTSFEEMRNKGGFVEVTGRTTTARQIKDGLADGWAQIVPKGHATATQVADMNDMIVLPLPDLVISGLIAKHGWAEVTIPPNTFKGQDQAVRTVKAATSIMVASSVPDDVVYRVTKAIMEGADQLPKIHAWMADFDPKRATEAVLTGSCPLHPGAAKYYREIELLK
jgi:TRAP transporter TAXI family solute receptor